MRQKLRPGLTERELWDITERAYIADGGTTHIHYFGVTPMDNPDCCVPRQFPQNRAVQVGELVYITSTASSGCTRRRERCSG